METGKIQTEAQQLLRQSLSVDVHPAIFKKRLERCGRWYTIVKSLGWGALLSMPHDQISNSFIEQTLRVDEISIWLSLVKRENKDAYEAIQQFNTWLGDYSIGASIQDKEPLYIESEGLQRGEGKIQEVQDSDKDEDDNDNRDSTTTAFTYTASTYLDRVIQTRCCISRTII